MQISIKHISSRAALFGKTSSTCNSGELAVSTVAQRKKSQGKASKRKGRKRKKSEGKDSSTISACFGTAVRLGIRKHHGPRPSRLGCSSRCRHATHLKESPYSSQNKADEWISEDIYKHFTETDSRPLSPENYSRKSFALARSSSVALDKARKCVTPEPDTKQCQFHNRRVLILDLRRVKSVDAITRQNSLTTGESIDSTYGDYDYDGRSSSANNRADSSSIFHHSTPTRNFSVSRSTSPKGGSKGRGRIKRPKDRSGSPVAYERSSSPKILEGLTLPPLHQSVLTLLGQKSGGKPSPRNHIKPADVSSALDPASASKAKKLRRHGRKKKAKEDGKESEEKELEKTEGAETRDRTRDNDELQETQLNTLQNPSDGESDASEVAEKNGRMNLSTPSYMKEIRSLRDVLDEHLCKQRWHPKEMENLTDEIEKISTELKKYQTDFKTKSIAMKEDTWLAFPRTWTRTSANFSVPSNSRLLKDLSPLNYLREYVHINEPRMHLYNLIYQRYRMLENPLGKTITTRSLQRALTEVLGRPFTDEEMGELQSMYLGIQDHVELDPKAFAGICAFCERVYGKYALENCSECVTCSKNTGHDKERCHIKPKSKLEEMDLSYLSNKIRYGEASSSLTQLISVLTISDRATHP